MSGRLRDEKERLQNLGEVELANQSGARTLVFAAKWRENNFKNPDSAVPETAKVGRTD